MRGASIIVGLAALACQDGAHFLPLSPPTGAETRIRLLTDVNQKVIEARVETPSEPVFEWEAPASATAVHILHYARRPEALGLSVGALDAGGRCKRACELEQPLAFESFALESAELEAGAPSEPARASIFEHLLPERATWCGEQCLRFETELVALEMSTRIIGAAALPDGAIWIVGRSGETRIFETDRTVSTGCTLTASTSFASAASDGRARLWASDYEGRLIAVALEAARVSGVCEIAEAAPTGDGEFFIFIAAGSEPDREVFGLGPSGRLWRYDDSGWHGLGSLAPIGPQEERRENAGAVIRLGPGRVLAFHDTREILSLDGDQTESKIVSVEGSNRLIAGAVSERGTIQLSAQGAGLIESSRVDGPWVVKLALPFEVLSAFWMLRGHQILVQKRSIEARHPELGTCGVTGLENVGLVKNIVPLSGGRDFVVADYSANPANAEVPPRFLLWVRTRLPCDD